jgi:hypothetical protein
MDGGRHADFVLVKKIDMCTSNPQITPETRHISGKKMSREFPIDLISSSEDDDPEVVDEVEEAEDDDGEEDSSSSSSSAPPPVPVVLSASQSLHVGKLLSILKHHPRAMDLSSMGLGKTFTGCEVCNRLPGVEKLLVVCPSHLVKKWQDVAARSNTPIHMVLSFGKLHGSAPTSGRISADIQKKILPHGLLTRSDVIVPKPKKSKKNTPQRLTSFDATEALLKLRKEGVLLIIDEMQRAKNQSSITFAACRELVSVFHSATPEVTDLPAVKLEPGSRVLLLSGTPMDKKEQARSLLKTLDIIRSDDVKKGDSELMARCTILDAMTTSDVLSRGATDSEDRCYTLFQRVVRPKLSSCMQMSDSPPRLICRDSYYGFGDSDQCAKIQAAVASLTTATSFDSSTNMVDKVNMTKVKPALMELEKSKVHMFVACASAALAADPNCKVVIALNYKESIQQVVDQMTALLPPGSGILRLEGKVKNRDRARVQADFQAPDLQYRLLVLNFAMCAEGIDLDDKHGTFPRVAFVSPTYSTMNLHQFAWRFKRHDTHPSDLPQLMNCVYHAEFHEDRIINAMARKGSVMKETTPEQCEAGVVFPGDFEVHVDPGVPKEQKDAICQKRHDAKIEMQKAQESASARRMVGAKSKATDVGEAGRNKRK